MKKYLTWLCLGVFLVAGVIVSLRLAALPRSYEGQRAAVGVYELLQDPDKGDESGADGAAAVIVQENLKTARAYNDVSSVVFDFRGYDTMGEAFLLITAAAGVLVILFRRKDEEKEERP